ncbi:L-threonylcarbamoyladenylate synthase [Mycoplasmopsis synoviae]|nr:Sua5/YciO/YrdC/YwlC family protein [Mycoplasmopsis synoviae]AKJ21018.1 TsaC protein (YrdC domain) required for threonylcarbamoyladenosine t(6)A37 modification in tRNA [Mycoplasmopsis synoviae]AQU48353.1 TsaC protein (YrdC domain) required for threonylcarbamoyladenosine t(6)A37 modification in tRNA [Mycoplasmopsis synoviae]AWL83926.1 SUA5-like translation suppressor [Mycoplasmopsis synoviae]MBD5788547.1 hypothetical protein [Mycoplasmopsis synoviae GX11-T]QLE13657.1 SUA5-like translation sup
MIDNFDDVFLLSTDTVCGLGVKLENKDSLHKLYALKNRPVDKKIMILAGSFNDIFKLTKFTKKQRVMAYKLLPGSNSIIVNNIGMRIPNCLKLRKFLIKNGPMYVTSANISGEKPLSIEEAQVKFEKIRYIVDYCSPSGTPSKIYNLDTGEILVRDK